MTAPRALLRLGWRDAKRDRWRTVLVVALVALPVALLGGAITSFDTMAASPQERADDTMGSADAAVSAVSLYDPGADQLGDLARQLPSGSQLEPHFTTSVELALPGERLAITATDISLDEPALAAPRYRVVEGRSPQTTTEIALTEVAAEDLDVGLGDQLTLVASDGSITDEAGEQREVVGIVRRPQSLRDRTVMVAPGSFTDEQLRDADLEVLIGVPAGTDTDSLDVLIPPSDDELRWWGSTRTEVLSSRFSGGERWIAVVAGGLALVEVSLIVGAAFAVSVRRRQRELGLLAAVGATTKHVRRVVVFTGLAAGGLGVVIGTLLGLIGASVAFPWLEPIAGREITMLRIDPLWLALVAAIGLASALLGAWWPARSVARLPVTVALSGRRPPAQPSVYALRWGAAVVALGLAVLLYSSATVSGPYVFLLGSVLLVLGTGLMSPWLLEKLGGLAPRLPAGARLAVRDAARFRTRNGPIVTAAMAGLAASITLATIIGSMDAQESASYTPSLRTDQVAVYGPNAESAAAAIAASTGGEFATFEYSDVSVTTVADPDDDGSRSWLGSRTAVGTPSTARLLAGEEAAKAIERGEVVLIGIDVDRVELVVEGQVPGTDEWELTVIGEEATATFDAPPGVEEYSNMLPNVLIPPSLVEDREIFASDAMVVLPRPVDDDLDEQVIAATSSVSIDGNTYAYTERGFRSSFATMLWVILGVGAVTGLIVVGVAIALAATEARADLRTLTAIGASRRTRRSLAAGRALLLSVLGGLLAVPVGLIPGYAVIARATDGGLYVPWMAVAIVAVGVPLVATAVAVLASTRTPSLSVRAG